MLELLAFLRGTGFATYVDCGGEVDFMRAYAERSYGIPPAQIIGSSMKLSYEVRGGLPVLVREPEVDFIDDKAGKPVGIQKRIGRRPVFAVGNSAGDLQMLARTTSSSGPHLGVIVHHTDAEREWAYDRDSQIGRLKQALDEAPRRGWRLVDMKRDWKLVYPFSVR